MKRSTFFQALVVGGALASPAPPADVTVKISGLTREQQGHQIVPGGLAPEVQELKPLYPNYAPNVQRKKVRYGKYTLSPVSSWSVMSLVSGEAGTMTSIAVNMKKPCDECGITHMQAGLEYENGTVANTDTGAWLHHIVVLMTGSGRSDSVCSITPGQRFFSSGNERLVIPFTDLANKTVHSVYPFKKSDTMSMQLELMNLKEETKQVYITLDYEFVPGPTLSGWKETKAVWFDITGCGISSTLPPRGKQAFTLSSPKWKALWDGDLISVGGHVHDGGTNVKTYLNTRPICDSRATYSAGKTSNTKSNAIAERDVAHGNEDMPHIEDMSYCMMMGSLKKGDTMYIDAAYDFNKHMGMKANSGGYAEIMGIAILYVAV